MNGLTTAESVNYLADEQQLGSLDLDTWPSYGPQQGDLHLLDWRGLFKAEQDEPDAWEIDGELVEAIAGVLGTGPPARGSSEEADIVGRRPEVCAWYQPIHFHGLDWGIFIIDDCLQSIAIDIARFVTVAHPWMAPSPWTYSRNYCGCPLRASFSTRRTITRRRVSRSGSMLPNVRPAIDPTGPRCTIRSLALAQALSRKLLRTPRSSSA